MERAFRRDIASARRPPGNRQGRVYRAFRQSIRSVPLIGCLAVRCSQACEPAHVVHSADGLSTWHVGHKSSCLASCLVCKATASAPEAERIPFLTCCSVEFLEVSKGLIGMQGSFWSRKSSC